MVILGLILLSLMTFADHLQAFLFSVFISDPNCQSRIARFARFADFSDTEEREKRNVKMNTYQGPG